MLGKFLQDESEGEDFEPGEGGDDDDEIDGEDEGAYIYLD